MHISCNNSAEIFDTRKIDTTNQIAVENFFQKANRLYQKAKSRGKIMNKLG